MNPQDYVGKWILDEPSEARMKEREKENGGLPVWAKGDPWFPRNMIVRVSEWKGRLTFHVVLGWKVKKLSENMGGVLDLSKIRKSEPGFINRLRIDEHGEMFAGGGRPDDTDKEYYRGRVLDTAPPWLKWRAGQLKFF
jgi:hypothetical protein